MALALRVMVPVKGLAGIGVGGQGCRAPVANDAGVRLRHRNEDAQAIDRRDAEELVGAGAGGNATRNQRADVGVARRHDAVIRSVDILKSLQLLQPANARHRRLDRGLLGLCVAHCLVGFLLGNGVRLEQILVASTGDVGEVQVGLRRLQIGLRNLQLLVDFGGFDRRHQLAPCARALRCRSTTFSGSHWCASRWAYPRTAACCRAASACRCPHCSSGTPPLLPAPRRPCSPWSAPRPPATARGCHTPRCIASTSAATISPIQKPRPSEPAGAVAAGTPCACLAS